ncbi:MAG: NAD(P)/FAD-dependent oxidoreductase [Alphaproteobacteria bacterium]|nr:NAD(P)/FAD-dependent oxidoreductase [Alphaproteobacteria bacterium]
MSKKIYTTDAIIIGAGPAGLFAVFELGLLDIRTHLIDILDRPGGQCAELYPEKPIYDIPALPVISGRQLTTQLMEQINPFSPVFHFSQMAKKLEKREHGWRVTTDVGTVIEAKIVVIASGGGSFVPKRPPIRDIESYEGKSVFYSVRNAEAFKDKNLVIAGGGDSALDWAIHLQPLVRSLTLVHRRAEFRAAPHSVAHMHQLVADEKMKFVIGNLSGFKGESGHINKVVLSNSDKSTTNVECDTLLAFYGLTMKPGPVATFGIEMKDNLIPVNTENFETSTSGVFAIGDICWYPGKLKLILSGFHEAALMAQKAFHYIHPERKKRFEYTTSSTNLQEKLGVK